MTILIKLIIDPQILGDILNTEYIEIGIYIKIYEKNISKYNSTYLIFKKNANSEIEELFLLN